MFIQRLLVLILVLACAAIPASATLTTYSSLASFNLATSDQTFQNITFAAGSLGTSLTDGSTQVVFSSSSSNGLTGIATLPGWPAGSSLEANACNVFQCITTLTITLPVAVTSIGMYVGLQNFNGFDITVVNTAGGNNSSSTGRTSNNSTPIFFGARSDTPFSTLTIATQDFVSNIYLDNMEIGTTQADTPVPEAATFLLIGSGLLMLHYGRRSTPRAA